MARPRVRRTSRNPSLKVSRKKTTKRVRPPMNKGPVSQLWNSEKTLVENYHSLGLAVKINDVGKNRNLVKQLNCALHLQEGEVVEDALSERVGKVISQEESHLEMHEKIREKAQRPVQKTVKFLSEQEKRFVADLIARHGRHNFEAMCRDRKLNTFQFTARQIERKVMKYLAESEE